MNRGCHLLYYYLRIFLLPNTHRPPYSCHLPISLMPPPISLLISFLSDPHSPGSGFIWRDATLANIIQAYQSLRTNIIQHTKAPKFLRRKLPAALLYACCMPAVCLRPACCLFACCLLPFCLLPAASCLLPAACTFDVGSCTLFELR